MHQFTHLHNHIASFDTFGSIEHNIELIKRLGYKSFASTEHGTLSQVLRIQAAAKANDIKVIIGLEPYITHNNVTHHITLLAKNLDGYKSLVALNNIAKQRGMHFKKRNASTITIEELVENNNGLILLSGCFNSPLQTEILDYDLLSLLKLTFKDDFYAEAQLTDKDYRHLKRAKEIADITNSKLVLTNDCHFVLPEYAEFHQQLMKSTSGFSYDSSPNYFASAEELLNRVGHDRELYDLALDGIRNTQEVDEKCSEFELKNNPQLPVIEDSDNKLKSLALDGYNEKLSNGDLVDLDRLNYELDVIIENGYSGYFLITKDLLDFSKKNGYKLGYGRGSAAGSLVAYCLGITNVNPLRYHLYFERFLNPSRIEMPDIDNDIPSAARQSVLQYAANKYGALSVAAFDSYSLLSTIVYAKKMSMFDEVKDHEWKAIQEEGDIEGERYAEFAKKYPKFDMMARALEGQVKNISKHAGGIVLIPDELRDYVPFEQDVDGNLIAGLSEGQASKDLAKIGAVKFDILGLTALDILSELKRITGVLPPSPDVGSLDEIKLLRDGKAAGIFQFSGAGIKKFTIEVAPMTFEDLVAISAVYRKGPLMGGTGDLYKKVKASGKPRKIHDEIDKILENTDGLIIYQEDVMRLYAWATDKDMAHADFARKTLVKYKKGDPKSEAAVQKLKDEMLAGMESKGISKSIQTKLWNEIITHSAYSFNRSHAVAYTMITWDLLWYKYHMPLDFYTVCLNYRSSEEKQQFIFDILDEDYEIKGVDINLSVDKYVNDGKNVFIPLTGVKGVGASAYEEIMNKRPFASIEDFLERCEKRKINKKVKNVLYTVGAFDNLSGDISLLGLDDYTKRADANSFYDIKIPSLSLYKEVKRVLSLVHPTDKFYAGIVVEKKLLPSGYFKFTLVPDGQVIFLHKDDYRANMILEDSWYSFHYKGRNMYNMKGLKY